MVLSLQISTSIANEGPMRMQTAQDKAFKLTALSHGSG